MQFEIDGRMVSAEPVTPSFTPLELPGRYRRTSDGKAVVSCPKCGQKFHLGERHPIESGDLSTGGSVGIVKMVECPHCGWWGSLALLAYLERQTKLTEAMSDEESLWAAKIAPDLLAERDQLRVRELKGRMFRCSNPNCGAIHTTDPQGHCPKCRQPDGSGWSCAPDLLAERDQLRARVAELEAALRDVLESEPKESQLKFRPVRCQLTAADTNPVCHCHSCASLRHLEAKNRAAELLKRSE